MAGINLRPALGQHLQQRVQAFQEGFRHNLALIGPPGSGKTFQLQQLIARQPSSLLVIYCPVYRESCRTFLNRLLGAILQAGQGTDGQLSLEALLDSVETELPKTVAAVRAVEGLLARRAYGEAFNRSLDVIPVLSGEREQPCLLILDEFLCLEELGLVHAFHELGKRVMTWPSTLFILSSSSPSRARAILRERLQLLFGQFELLTLDALDPARASAWVHQELRPLRGLRQLSPFLIWWLGAYPWYLALVLRRLKEVAALRHAPELTEPLFLQALWNVLGSAEGSLHQWCVSRTTALANGRQGTRSLEVLLQIADGARTATEIGRRIGRAGLPGALQLLVEHDLAQRNGICWVAPDPVLRAWLCTCLWVQRSEVRLGTDAARRRFEQYVLCVWRQWAELQQRSLTDHVASLFAQFADETVSLDQKTGRLPRFQRIESRADAQGAGAYLVAEGGGKRWCCSVAEGPVTEERIGTFEAFCRSQQPRPSRKVLVASAGLDENAKVLAKAANMWVWGTAELELLTTLYGQPRLGSNAGD